MSFESAFTMDTSAIKFGPGVTREVGEDAKGLGATRVMVVTDPVLVNHDAIEIATGALELLDRGANGVGVAVAGEPGGVVDRSRPPLVLGSRRWATMACRFSAKSMRSWSWAVSGKKLRMRLMAWLAFLKGTPSSIPSPRVCFWIACAAAMDGDWVNVRKWASSGSSRSACWRAASDRTSTAQSIAASQKCKNARQPS